MTSAVHDHSFDPALLIFDPPVEHIRSALIYIERMAADVRGIDPDARNFYHRILARLTDAEAAT